MEGHRIQVEEETSNLWAAHVMSVSTAVYIHAHVQCTLYIHIIMPQSYMYIIMMYMAIYVNSTLALRKQKEKKGKVTHPTIAQTNKRIKKYVHGRVLQY